MKKFNKKTLCAMGMALSALMAAKAQNADSVSHYYLDELVISGTRTEKKLLEIPRSMNLITYSDIKTSGATSLGDLLSFYEGVTIFGNDLNPGSVQTYFLRGVSGDQSKIMIDGIRLSDPSSTNNAVDLSEISLSDVKQVEIVKGPHSTLYGSSAIGGMINIITHKKLDPGFNARALLTGGTFGNFAHDVAGNVALNYTFSNNFYLSGNVFSRLVKGIDATLDTVKSAEAFKNRDRDDFRKTDVALKTGYASDNTDAFLSFMMADNFAEIDRAAYADDENNTLALQRKTVSYSVKHKISPFFEIWANGALSGIQRVNENDSSLTDYGVYDRNYYKGTFSGRLISNELQLSFFRNDIYILAGTGMNYETMSAESYTYSGNWNYESVTSLDSLHLNKTLNHVFVSFGLNGKLVNDKLNFLNVNGGLRFNYENNGNSYFTYEVNPSVKIGEKTVIFGSVATGFNSPSLYKLYTPERNYVSGITRGNPGLEEETSFAFEAGYKQQIGRNLFFTMSAFRNQVENTIQYVYLWDGNIGIDSLGNDWMRNDNRGDTYLNMGTLTMQGIEAGLGYSIKNFTLRANIFLQKGNLRFDPADIDEGVTGGNHVQLYESGRFINTGQKLNNLPRRVNAANIMAKYHFSTQTDLGISLKMTGKKSDIYYSDALGPYGALDSRMLKGYALLNISCNQRITNFLSAGLKINNIMNTGYVEIIGYRTKGRSVYLSLFFDIDKKS